MVQVTVGELEAAEKSGMLAAVPDEPTPTATKSVEALGLKLTNITPELRRRAFRP